MKVWYMNGAGNDFMVLDGRGKTLAHSRLAVELCKLTHADGYMAVDTSEIADFKLHFYNSDGSRGEMCGNGARCVCRFAYENGIAGENMVVETDAGLVPGRRLTQSQYQVGLNPPSVVDAVRKPGVTYVELGNPGVPHGVMEVPRLDWEQREVWRAPLQALRHDPAFPKGANASAYAWLDDTTVKILTFERGVEDFTLACGTGSGSVAVAAWAAGKLPGGVLTVKNPGGDLKLTVQGENGAVSALLLEGPTQLVRILEA